jgi:hypothetical protein
MLAPTASGLAPGRARLQPGFSSEPFASEDAHFQRGLWIAVEALQSANTNILSSQ